VIELLSYLKGRTIKPVISFSLVRVSIKFGLPLTGVFIMSLLLAVIDKFCIVQFLGPHDLGIYSLGYKISEMSIQNIFMVLLLPAYPAIIKTFENEGKSAAGKSLKNYISIYFVFLVPVLMILWGMAKEFCLVFLGDKYQGCYVILGLIAAGIFILGLSHYVVKVFLLIENSKKIFYFLLISVIINIILNIILIPNFGIKGAAYSTLISYFCYLSISYIVIKKEKKFPIEFPWLTLFKTIIAAGVMLIVIILLPAVDDVWGFGLKAGVCVVIYLSLLALFKEGNISGFFQVAKKKLRKNQ
jgi:O-antigen/teichoic acid export membrane protein